MSFDKASDFLFSATQKYNLGRQAQASLVCQRVRRIFNERYSELAELWAPSKYDDGVLFIQVENSSASSELFLRTHEMMELFQQMDFPEPIHEIRIVRK
ncbi:DUF721 domain-containing protein [Candidatus Gracilibacteria bacterium]|nr:DUF721 domain-containing protein [Candidatus Gracilibacteria bacterium]MCF7819496.1 DUF721 domain-containing protein [Candidatus Gracilibacteria bacterium]